MKLKLSMTLDVDDSDVSLENLKHLKFSGVKNVSDLNISEVKEDDETVSIQTKFGRLEAYPVDDDKDGYTGIYVDLVTDDGQRLLIMKCEQEPDEESEGEFELKGRTFSGDTWEDVPIMYTGWLPKKPSEIHLTPANKTPLPPQPSVLKK